MKWSLYFQMRRYCDIERNHLNKSDRLEVVLEVLYKAKEIYSIPTQGIGKSY